MDYEGNKVTHRAAKELLALVLWAVVGSACWAETSIEKLQFNFYGSFIHTQKIPNALFYFDEIAKGDSFDLRKAMRNHDIDIIVLSSMGGSVSEGLQMGGIIHDNNLKTYVPKRGQLGEGNCASACALMFFGGVAREVGGKLGVHQFYSQNFNESAKTGDIQGETQFIAGEIIGFLNSFNTPPFVLEKMFQQSDMYYFSEAEIELLGASKGTLSHSKTTQINSFIRSLVEASENIDVESSQKALTHVAPETAPAVISPEEAEVTLIRFVVAKGETSLAVVDALNKIDFLTGVVSGVPPEGSLAPDSYDLVQGQNRNVILANMAARQERILSQAWAERAANVAVETPQEALILASIIEKEVGITEDHRQVASVFTNRLKQGIRLQSNPTVIYGITRGKVVLRRGLRRSELLKETPWNTYFIDGLPPTPIGNPSFVSIQAALSPDETPYIFFVADGTGGHAFAETLAEHAANVAKRRQIEADRADN